MEKIYVIVPITEMVGKFLMTFKDYPASQTAGSFNLTKMQKQIESATSGR
jgi:arylsulfatase